MPEKELLAGAATAVITPTLGVSLCGALTDREARNLHDELFARSLVIDNGDLRIALVVLDLIAAPKEWLGKIKHDIHGHTNIPLSNILISCTHTHSAVTTVPFFQSNVVEDYREWAQPRIADSVRVAVNRLQPARIGWAVGREDRVIFNRRYLMKPGTPLPNPFGNADRVMMNPGVGNPAIDRPAGPVDPEIAILAVQKADERSAGTPLALYASYGLHYVDSMPVTDVSADYFGVVSDLLHDLTHGPRRDLRQPFVALLANACFGDINNVDVHKEIKQNADYEHMEEVAGLVARAIHAAWKDIQYHDWVHLAVKEKSLDLAVRKPAPAEMDRARDILTRAPQAPLSTLNDIYARETIQLAAWPDIFTTPVQVIRIGDLGLCALPGEPFSQTGLDIKAKSPFKPTMMVGMANDYAGYLPTEEQHALGGYETWRAKSSFLEVKAASKIQAAALQLLAEAANDQG